MGKLVDNLRLQLRHLEEIEDELGLIGSGYANAIESAIDELELSISDSKDALEESDEEEDLEDEDDDPNND